MKKILLISMIIFATGCSSNHINSHDDLVVLSNSQNGEFVYKPEGREQFVFGEILPSLQKYAYSDVCYEMPKRSVSWDCSLNKLPYDEYVGLKGYFTDRAPFSDKYNTVREVVIENGKVAYLITESKWSGVGEDFISLEKHNKIKNFKPYPIIEGGDVEIIGYSKLSREEFALNNYSGSLKSQDEIDLIIKTAKMFPENSAKIADLLSNFIIKEDKFDNRIIISDGIGNDYGTKLSIRIVVRPNDDVSSYYIVDYHAENWIFATSISVAGNGKKWDSPKLEFDREHNDGIIRERAFTRNSKDSLSAFENLANSEDPKIRIYGDKYSDGKISEAKKTKLGYLVDLTKLMSST